MNASLTDLAAPLPKVAIIMTAFRHEAFVEEALTSLLKQECPPIRILASDDCSEDRTYDIMQRVAAAYRGPHSVAVQRNYSRMGLVPHVVRCVEQVEADWLIMAAGDDISAPGRVANILKVIRRCPWVDGVGSDVRYVDAKGQVLNRPRDIRGSLGRLLPLPMVHWHRCRRIRSDTPRRRALRLLIDGSTGLRGATAAWRRSLFTDYPPIAPGCSEDFVLNFRAALGGGVVVLPMPLIDYRVHGTNAWSMHSVGASPGALSALAERKWRFLVDGLRQNVLDLDDAASRGIISPELAAECLDILRTRRFLVELAGLPSPRTETAAALGSFLMRQAIWTSAHASTGRLPRNRAFNVVQYALGGLVSRLMR